MQTYYPSAFAPRLRRLSVVRGSEITLSVDWEGMETELGTDLEAAEWHAVSGVTLSSQALTDSTSSVLASVPYEGVYVLECWGQFEDGQLRKQQFEIEVTPTIQ